MKKPTILLSSIVFVVFMTACGSGQPRTETEEKQEAAPAQEMTASEEERLVKSHDPQSLGELAREGLTALIENDADKVKELVERNVSYYVDDRFINHQAAKIEDWDGEIRAVKFRKDDMTGRPEAVAYFADVDEDNIQVHVLDYFNEGWHILGGRHGIEKISREEFEDYADAMEEVMN